MSNPAHEIIKRKLSPEDWETLSLFEGKRVKFKSNPFTGEEVETIKANGFTFKPGPRPFGKDPVPEEEKYFALDRERKDMFAVGSARYILEDLNNEQGMKDIERLTGVPMGVIVSAFENIFYDGYND